MARIQPTTSSGVPAFLGGGGGTGLTLDALMTRQRDLANMAAKISPSRPMQSPWQGAAYLGEVLANKVNQGRADTQLAEGRDQLAQLVGGIDWGSGPSAEQISGVMARDPDLGMQLVTAARDAVMAARQRQQQLADRDEERTYDRTVDTEKYQRDRKDKLADDVITTGREESKDVREEQQRIEQERRAQADQIEDEKRAAAAAADKPLSTEGQIMRDFNNGLYGDPATPEAIATKDQALKSARGGGRGSAQDRKALFEQQDAYLNSTSAVGALRRAEQLLGEGIDTGYLAGVRTAMGQNDTPGAGLLGADKELAKRTKEYNDLMTQEAVTAMSQALKGATTDTEMARFIEIMNDPLAHPDVKRQNLTRMLAKANAFLELQRGRIEEMGGEAPQMAMPAAPDISAQLLEEARQAIAKGAPADLVKKRLMEKGVDPGGL